MTTMNANIDPKCADLAATLAGQRLGTFTGLVTRKVGKTAGRGADKKLYGDDLVHVVVVTGFSYTTLKEKDAAILANLTPATLVAEAPNLKDGKGAQVTEADFAAALLEMTESADKSVDGTNESTTDHVFTPLVVDGKTVRGGVVYNCVAKDPNHECKCRDCSGDPKAPADGTIYLSGLKIGETVIEAAANGAAPATVSAAKTVAKDWIRRKLPSRRYTRYRLEAGGDWILRIGGSAAVEADKDGVKVSKSAASLLDA